MTKTSAMREPGLDVVRPRWSDVQSIMQQILVDDGEQALSLRYETDTNASELVIIRANDASTGEAVGWLVHYIPASGRASQILTTNDPPGTYVTLEFFGSMADVPESGLVPEELIQSATTHFLECGDMDPALTWANYFSTIRNR